MPGKWSVLTDGERKLWEYSQGTAHADHRESGWVVWTGDSVGDEGGETNEEIKKIIKIISNPSKGFNYTAISLYGAGGAISDVDKSSTAYYYRDANFIVGIQSVWEDDIYAEVNKEWVKENFSTIKNITNGSFVNFPLDELDNFEKEYYGENISKLREIKSKYDPLNVFNYPQANRGKS